MEVWFPHAAKNQKELYTCVPPKRVGRAFALLTKTYYESKKCNCRSGSYRACGTTLQRGFLFFEMGEAMPASANFLKFKVCPADFDNTIAAKQSVAFSSYVN